MGLMFGKIIPMNMLARMPLPFVHRLRDIRIKQLQEANKQQELQMQQARVQQQRNMTRGKLPPNWRPPAQPQNISGGFDPAMFNGTPFDDIIDELT